MSSYKPLTEENVKDFKNFKYSEFKCKCKGKYCNGYPVPFSYELAKNLQKIRDYFGKPLMITSPLRCIQHNKNFGGVSNSKHLKGCACDFYINGISYDSLYKYVKTLPYFHYAYKVKKNQNVIHYDITPPNYIVDLAKTVERNESKDQLKVMAKDLRIRDKASTNGNILGIAETNGIYDYFEVLKDDEYAWYKIDDNEWIADNGNYLIIYPKEDKEEDMKELQEQLDNANKEIEKLKKQIEELQVEETYKFMYQAIKDGKYTIQLKKDEILVIK